jgi:hypothetical protein
VLYYKYKEEETIMKRVLVKHGSEDIIGILLEDTEHKFIITQKNGSIEIHFPKISYTYTVLEDE